MDEMIKRTHVHPVPTLFDCYVTNLTNCFPTIPSGKAHNEMLLPDEGTDERVATAIGETGRAVV